MAQPHGPTWQARLWHVAQGSRDDDLMAHLATCAECQDALATLGALASYRETTGGALAEAPVALVARVSALLPRVRPDLVHGTGANERLVDRLSRVVAELLLDTSATPQPAGLRSGASDRRTRQLAFVSDVADLDLEVSQFDDVFGVAGQLGMESVPPNLTIQFVPAEEDPLAEDVASRVESAISSDGYFEVTLGAGEWVAAVEFDDAVVLFPGVHL